MRFPLSLSHCRTPEGNRLFEAAFQQYVFHREPDSTLAPVALGHLDPLISRARKNHEDGDVVKYLAQALADSLGREAYAKFIEDFGPDSIFYDVIIAPRGIVDRNRTKRANYPKYCLFKFASFLDLLRPGVVHWRGQADPNSMSLAQRGLRRFLRASETDRESIIARWLKHPHPSAFSEERTSKLLEAQKRKEFLLSLPANLAPVDVADRLDEAGFRPKSYESYGSWVRILERRQSFYSWLSKERKQGKLERMARQQPRPESTS